MLPDIALRQKNSNKKRNNEMLSKWVKELIECVKELVPIPSWLSCGCVWKVMETGTKPNAVSGIPSSPAQTVSQEEMQEGCW